MSYELTPDRLQSLAISCVTQFITKQASLSEAIAKEAQELELNSDQTKRVIEVSNTLAYLRQLEKSADRTFEFDVADYNKVMAHMCMPDDLLKSAGNMPPWLNKDKDKKENSNKDDGVSTKSEKEDDSEKDKSEKKDESKESKFEKKNDSKDTKPSKDEDGEGDSKDKDTAEEKEEGREKPSFEAKERKEGEEKAEKSTKSEDKEEKFDNKEEVDAEAKEQEKKAMLGRGYFQARSRLEKIAYDKIELHLQLSTSANKVHSDPHGYEKLAEVIKGDDFDKACRLCGIEKRAGEDLVFRTKELTDVKTVIGLWKSAEALVKEEKELREFIKRAEAILFQKTANVEKLGSLGSIATKAISGVVGSVAEGAGKLLGFGAKTVGQGVYRAGQSIGAPSAFMQQAKATGLANKDQAVKAFDALKQNKGLDAATSRFGGNKPGLLKDRIGPVNLGFGALTAAGLTHKTNAKDLNQ